MYIRGRCCQCGKRWSWNACKGIPRPLSPCCDQPLASLAEIRRHPHVLSDFAHLQISTVNQAKLPN